MTLRPIPVQHLDQIERVRLIRNTTKQGYSNHNAEISEAEQIAWWEREKPLAWLYADEASVIVGFGLLRQDDAGHWVTVVGVLPEHGGKGYGKEITHSLVMRSPGQCWATARKDNPAAVKLHVAEDWETIDGPDPRLVYFRTWPPEPRDFTFAMQPSLRPTFAVESDPDCRVEWCRHPDGRMVRVTSWVQKLERDAAAVVVVPEASPWLDPATGRELGR